MHYFFALSCVKGDDSAQITPFVVSILQVLQINARRLQTHTLRVLQRLCNGMMEAMLSDDV